MTTRIATRLGISLAICCVAAHIVSAILLRAASQAWDPGFLLMLGFQFIGVVIVSFRTGPGGGIFSDLPQLMNPFGMTAVDMIGDTASVLGLPITMGAVAASLLAIIVRVRRTQGIERIVNRGLVYLALTVSLALVYFGLTLTLGGLLRGWVGTSSNVVTAVSTLTAAALFSPLRVAIQRIVDRRFYRRKHDAAQMVERFSEHLRDEVDLAALIDNLTAVTQKAMQPAHVSIWLRSKRPR